MKLHSSALLLGLLACLLISSPSEAQEPTTTKYLSRATLTPENNSFGKAVALSESYLVISEPSSDEGAVQSGGVSVFSATSGRLLRKLKGTAPQAHDRFGASLSLSGAKVLVGCPGDDLERGSAYVFDVSTGRLLRRLLAVDGVGDEGPGGDGFGNSVALVGNIALVGAARHDPGTGADAGAVYVFDITTGVQLRKLVASDGAVGLDFGVSVAFDGKLAAIGSLWTSNKGAVYLFDVATGTEIKRFNAADAEVNDAFGCSVALVGNLLVAGARSADSFQGAAYVFNTQTGIQLRKLTASDGAPFQKFGRSVALTSDLLLVAADETPSGGAAYLFDIHSGLELRKIVPADGAFGDSFGASVALHRNQALIGAPNAGEGSASDGAAYYVRPLVTSKPLTFVAAKGTTAPGGGTAKYGTLSPPVVSSADASAYMSTLTGTGAMATGLWRESAGSSTFIPRYIALFGLRSVGSPIHNDDNEMVFRAVVLPTGFFVTSANNSLVLRSDSDLAPTVVLQEGAMIPTVDSLYSSFNEVVQDYDFNGGVASSVKLRSSPSVRVTAANDSAVVRVNAANAVANSAAEGQISTAGSDIRWGQVGPRVAIMNSKMLWSSALVAGPTTPPGTLTTSNNQALTLDSNIIWRSGDSAAVGANYRTFLAASIAYNNEPTFKATLTGPSVTTATNEGIYRFGLGQVVRKGDFLNATEFPGVKISRIIKFWALIHGQVIFLAGLSGTGVTTANDVALVLAHPYDRHYVLLREGASIGTSDGTKIASIQKVDVEPVGSQYVVLASLTGSTATNLALFTGRTTDFGPATINPRLARAGMKLRKGTAYDTGLPGLVAGVQVKITSMSITNTTDTLGAGAKGLGQAINDQGSVGLTIDFSNGIREIRKGIP